MKINGLVILLGVLSIAFGAFLNDRIYKNNNEKLLAQLKSELALQNQTKSRVSGEDKINAEVRTRELEAQIRLVQRQLA